MADIIYTGKYKKGDKVTILSFYKTAFTFGFSKETCEKIVEAGRCFRVAKLPNQTFFIDSYQIYQARKKYNEK